MFIRPEQVARIVDQLAGIARARVEVSLQGDRDQITVKVEPNDSGQALEPGALQTAIAEILKLKTEVGIVAKGELPRDGILIADLRPVPE